jgi:transposase InsO family protein
MNKFDPRYLMLQEEKLSQIINKQKKVTAVARELNVSRQTVHEWLNRYKRFGINGLIKSKRKKRKFPPANKTPQELEQLIVNLSKHYLFDGVETLSDRVQAENNIKIHPTTIYRILKRNKARYQGWQTWTKKRWKKKLYAHKTPGKELQMDTKYPYGYKEGKVIYTIIDDASRWVFAWSYSKATKENTLNFLEKVIQRAPFSIQKIRTDQGKEFIANDVKNFLRSNKIKFRNNTPYCPEENGKIERFHKTLNQKALRWGFYPKDTLDEMQYKLNLFLHYYNYQKKHRGLGMDGMTPMQKLEESKSVNLTLQCYKN